MKLNNIFVLPYPADELFKCRQARELNNFWLRVLFATAAHNNELRATYDKLVTLCLNSLYAYYELWLNMTAVVGHHVRDPALVRRLERKIYQAFSRKEPLIVDCVVKEANPVWDQNRATLADPFQVQELIELMEGQNKEFCRAIGAQQQFVAGMMPLLSAQHITGLLRRLLTGAGATPETIKCAQMMFEYYRQEIQDFYMMRGVGAAAATKIIYPLQEAVDVFVATAIGCAALAMTAMAEPAVLPLQQQQQLTVCSSSPLLITSNPTGASGISNDVSHSTGQIPADAAVAEQQAGETAACMTISVPLEAENLVVPSLVAAASVAADLTEMPADYAAGGAGSCNASAAAEAPEEVSTDGTMTTGESSADAHQYDAVTYISLPAWTASSDKAYASSLAEVGAETAGHQSDDAAHCPADCCSPAASYMSSSNSRSRGSGRRSSCMKTRKQRLLGGVVRVLKSVAAVAAVAVTVQRVMTCGIGPARQS